MFVAQSRQRKPGCRFKHANSDSEAEDSGKETPEEFNEHWQAGLESEEDKGSGDEEACPQWTENMLYELERESSPDLPDLRDVITQTKAKATTATDLFNVVVVVEVVVSNADRSGKKHCRKSNSGQSHRAKKHQYEEPVFAESEEEDEDNQEQDGDSNSSYSNEDTNDGNRKCRHVSGSSSSSDKPPGGYTTAAGDFIAWPGWTNLHLNRCGIANLTKQDRRVCKAVENSICKVDHDLAFTCPYPEKDGNKYALMRAALIHGARAVSGVLARCVATEPYCCGCLVYHLANRVSHFRMHAFKTAVALVPAAYGLVRANGTQISAADAKLRIKDLFVNCTYTFTLRDSPKIRENAIHYTEELTLSLEGNHELEIPLPMLAMGATTVTAALNCWASGCYVSSLFHVNSSLTIYKDHMVCLNTIKEKAVQADVQVTQGGATEDARVVDYANMPE
ncbi:hypothetical protein EIP91_012150 [Steccherinum ochraceum]|uniref:DUF6532 domain-containing protein n=1 Tax=Steccherinum ochraceum TaxID=92696 RepID=A0A4R0RGT1_9APHY|nr:hypothetical protein EIP91_012150 [Steccherinum ochraceum]